MKEYSDLIEELVEDKQQLEKDLELARTNRQK
jgi:hypothetical protein